MSVSMQQLDAYLSTYKVNMCFWRLTVVGNERGDGTGSSNEHIGRGGVNQHGSH